MPKFPRTPFFIAVAGLALAASLLLTGAPVRSVTPAQHPNLAAAQKLCAQAWDKIVAAQKANEWDLAGHAQKAKDLLEQANAELKLAVEVSSETSSAK